MFRKPSKYLIKRIRNRSHAAGLVKSAGSVLILVGLTSCNSTSQTPISLHSTASRQTESVRHSEDLYVVDCLLPASIRKLGQQLAYKAGRQAIKTTAADCRIRGGDYAVPGQAGFSTALQTWLPGAQAGDAAAQAYMGELYEKGPGGQADYSVARRWYQKAAAQGYARAKSNLGYLYERGLGVAKDLPRALTLYREASGLENTDLDFAASVETALRAELDQEVQLLKTELQRSQIKSQRLNQAIQSNRKQLSDIRHRTGSIAVRLQQTRKRIAILRQSPYGDDQVASRSQTLKQTRQRLIQEEAELAQKWRALQQQGQALSGSGAELMQKLLLTEQRATRLDRQLLKQSTDRGQVNQRLQQVQTRLSEAESALSQLSREFESEKKRLHRQQRISTASQQQQSQAQGQAIQSLQAQLAALEADRQRSLGTQQKLETELAQLEIEKQRLQNRVELSQQEKNQQLQQYAQQLTTVSRRLQAQRHQLERLQQDKQALTTGQAAFKQQSQSELEQLDAQMQQQTQMLAQQKQLIAQYRQEEQALQSALADTKSPVSVAQQSQPAVTVPSIEIIDPPLTVTRGLPTIRLRSSVRYQDINGRVEATEGILSFLINDRSETVDASGVFKTRVALNADKTPVRIVAVDNNGQRSAFDFMVITPSEKKRPVSTGRAAKRAKTPAIPVKDINFGRYYALIIGNNRYEHLPGLDTPINDAQAIDGVLKSVYGFQTKLLLDANRYTILSALNELRGQLTDQDNLFIYYAGHGELDEINMRGHWLPIDAEGKNTANWISTIAITDILNAMNAKHVMVVADSCYSGAMTRTALARLEPGMSEGEKRQWMATIARKRVRTVMTSGSLTPVLDGLGGNHSVFAKAFLQALKRNTGILVGQNLYRSVSGRVQAEAAKVGFDQSPQYAPLRHTGHEAGDFFFVPRKQQRL